ncbi:MAG: choice-of-anchor K domain-containing protein [Verrucomicrobiota bacterium]
MKTHFVAFSVLDPSAKTVLSHSCFGQKHLSPGRFNFVQSIIEILITVVTIGILASVTSIAVTRVSKATQERKLESDVQAMNSAIRIYLANGGDLGGISDANDVLGKLKTSRTKADKELHVGAPSGRMIDRRVTTSAVAGDSWKARANYDAGSQRFQVVSGIAGFEFILDDALAEQQTASETREHGALSYAANSTWVWDHASTNNPNAPGGPSSFNTNPNVDDSTPGVPVVTPPPPPKPGGGGGSKPPKPPEPPKPPKHPTPKFSKDGGGYSEDDFPLTVTITNVPSAATADAVYQINGSAWTAYSGPVSVPMNSTLRAQFLTTDSTAFRDSSRRSEYYYPVAESLSGTVQGDFHSPKGGPNLSYTISPDGDTFEHGDSVYLLDGQPINTGDPNRLNFSGKNFSNIAPGQKFVLGSLFYHNGNSYYDSHARSVKLDIDISLPERGETVSFTLDLDLINTENDPDDPNASADYVRIKNLQQKISLKINDVPYKIKLAFGATDSFGFSSESQFHVYEGATGEGEILGTFLPNN